MIVGYLMPHPPLLVMDGNDSNTKATRVACTNIGKKIDMINPQVIIVITPHNVIYNDYFHIAPKNSAIGDFKRFGSTYSMEVKYDEELSNEIVKVCKKNNINAGFLGEKDKKLDHGIMVPLSFIKMRNIVNVSISGLSIEEHYEFGKAIKESLLNLERKFIVIASGDMSHKLRKDGPYGYVKEGEIFDDALCNCLKKNEVSKIFNIESTIVSKACECGYKSLAVLLGVLADEDIKSEVLAYEKPYGVGYLTVSFESMK